MLIGVIFPIKKCPQRTPKKTKTIRGCPFTKFDVPAAVDGDVKYSADGVHVLLDAHVLSARQSCTTASTLKG